MRQGRESPDIGVKTNQTVGYRIRVRSAAVGKHLSQGLRASEVVSELRVSEPRRKLLLQKERQMWKISSSLGQGL